MKRLLIPLTMLAVLLVAAPASASDHDGDTGTVTVLHGVPGLDVDVYADGEILIEGFAPGDSFGPTELPAADYAITVFPAGEDPEGDPAISADVTVPAGVNATAIAHLDADGAPTLSVFVNDVSQLDAGDTRLVVRHTAAFGPVDVLANDGAVIEGLTNPNESDVLEIPADTYDVAVTAAGDPDTEALRADLALEEGTAYFVHAIGDPGADTFDVLVQTVDGLHTAPAEVHTGSGGLAADGGGSAIPAATTALVIGLLGLGLVAKPVLARR
jgi:hypothetical protein